MECPSFIHGSAVLERNLATLKMGGFFHLLFRHVTGILWGSDKIKSTAAYGKYV
jgi:hypothetical protein